MITLTLSNNFPQIVELLKQEPPGCYSNDFFLPCVQYTKGSPNNYKTYNFNKLNLN